MDVIVVPLGRSRASVSLDVDRKGIPGSFVRNTRFVGDLYGVHQRDETRRTYTDRFSGLDELWAVLSEELGP